MAVKKLQAIRAASKPVFKPDAANLVWLVIVGIGLLPFTLLALLALVVILVLLVMFAGGSQLTHSPDPSVSGSSAPGEIITELAGGDGRGTFAGANVPDQKLVEPIVDAAQECDLLTPVIIAAQIEWASGFDPKWEGPDGGKGLSQLPPEVFGEFGEDDDENGEVSAFDPEDSIYAHARYFCHLAGEVKRLIDDNKVIGGHLTLTLMAWDMGLEAVEAAGGMPIIYLDSYPFLVRGLFAKYTADAGASSTTAPSTSPIAVPSPARVEAGRRTTAPPAPGGTSRLSAAQFEEFVSEPELLLHVRRTDGGDEEVSRLRRDRGRDDPEAGAGRFSRDRRPRVRRPRPHRGDQPVRLGRLLRHQPTLRLCRRSDLPRAGPDPAQLEHQLQGCG
ncbi:hypothetical protein GCM10027575_00680 [Phytohabitans suffuscus]